MHEVTVPTVRRRALPYHLRSIVKGDANVSPAVIVFYSWGATLPGMRGDHPAVAPRSADSGLSSAQRCASDPGATGRRAFARLPAARSSGRVPAHEDDAK